MLVIILEANFLGYAAFSAFIKIQKKNSPLNRDTLWYPKLLDEIPNLLASRNYYTLHINCLQIHTRARQFTHVNETKERKKKKNHFNWRTTIGERVGGSVTEIELQTKGNNFAKRYPGGESTRRGSHREARFAHF